eukprot:14369522-Ditylum_brightwellii.AAC.1
MISLLFGTSNKGNGRCNAKTTSAMATSNTEPPVSSNTSTESTGEAKEDENSSRNQDKNLEERQAEDKNSLNCTNLQVDTAENGASSAEIINYPPKEGPLPEPSAQECHQWSK